ncbi:MAG: hypothetical protein QOG81_2085 [Gaiellaceae bacterium]|nr:hypothetical protein [Gaiellaceae bacterium]
MIAGVLVVNVVAALVGYSLVGSAGRSVARTLSYLGLAIVVGTGAIFAALGVLAPFGLRIGLGAFLVVAAGLCVVGLVLRRRLRWSHESPAAPPPRTLLEDAVVTASAFGLVVLGAIVFVGAFRSVPWLDDTWYFWLPKGRALDKIGLDPSLWRPDPHFTASYGDGQETLRFIRPDNPLWFSMLLERVVPSGARFDFRTANVELAVLLVSFVGATARLLWGRVRQALLLPALLLVFAAPELLRQAQGGAADVPLAIYLALALLAAAGWLAERRPVALVLLVVCGSAAVAMKTEGLFELPLFLAVLSLAAWRARRALLPLWAACAGAIATVVPWLVWRSMHGVSNVFSIRDALSPSYLSGRTDLLRSAAHILGHDFTSVRQWSLILPLTIILGAAAGLRDRRVVWLAPAVGLLASYVLFVWVSWADPEGSFRLIASAYRYVTPPLVTAGVFLPILAEKTLGAARHRAAKT